MLENSIALDFLIGFVLFVVGAYLIMYHIPSHLLFQVGGIILLGSFFPLARVLIQGIK